LPVNCKFIRDSTKLKLKLEFLKFDFSTKIKEKITKENFIASLRLRLFQVQLKFAFRIWP